MSTGITSKKLPRSRASSPSHCRSRAASFSLSQKPRDALRSPEIFINARKSVSPSVDGNLAVMINPSERSTLRHERVIRAIRKVENELDERLRTRELIGQIIDRKSVDRVRIKARRVIFTWQRGIKIGASFRIITCMQNFISTLYMHHNVLLLQNYRCTQMY